ncbi:MAG TPA: DUF2254 domain-containing protein [Solirubrobacteraceae bacterium]|nr:DUF2254 domain-containing protein [Solirubrobacteraceae bacterium]
MSWASRFRFREYLRESLWVVPALGAVAGILAAAVLISIDSHVAVPSSWSYSPSTASTVLSAIVGAVAALTGFVVTVTVLVAQMASGSFSPRSMRLWYRDPVLKGSLALLIGTLAYSFSLLRRIESTFVPDLGVTLAGVLLIVGLVIFVLFLNRFVHLLRPAAVAARVAKSVRKSLDNDIANTRHLDNVFAGPLEGMTERASLTVRAARAGAVQAVDLGGIAAWAGRHDCLVVMRHSVGEFIETGDVLFEVYGNLGQPDPAERALRGLVALGLERTIEQDLAFALRVMVDVASRALSPAVNDPTTAVQVLDYLGDSLRVIGKVDRSGTPWHTGAAKRGVVVPVRRWEDFLALGVTEIREFGSTSVQVMRRMRAVLEKLLQEVRPENRAAVKAEIARLDATVAAAFSGSIDRDRADIADRQGMGGPDRLVEPVRHARCRDEQLLRP